MKRIVIAPLCLLIVSSFLVGCGLLTESNSRDETGYKIGVAVPLTGKGSSAGKMEVVGITMAVNEINESGGINGKQLSISLVDTAGDPKEAANAVRKLASENVLAIAGPHYSGEAEVTYPIGDELGIVQIALASSKPGLSDGFVFGFRNIATEDQVSEKVLAKWVEEYDIKTVAIITDIKSSVTKSIGEDIFPAILKELGVTVLTLNDPITYQTGDVDFSAQITKAIAHNADGIGLGSLGGDALNILAKAQEQGLKKPFVGAAPLLEGELEKKGGEEVQGIFSGSAFYLADESPRVQEFVKKYRELAPKMYSGISSDPLHYCANAYDAIHMLAQAIEKTGVSGSAKTIKADRKAIQQYLSELKDFDGLNSKGFDDTHRGIKEIFVLKIEGDRWVRVD